MSENSNSIYAVPEKRGASEAEDTLLSYPPAIKKAQEALLIQSNNYENQNVVVKEIVAGFNSQIQNNPALKNEGQRNVEIKAKMAASGEYNDAIEALSTLKYQIEVSRIDLEYLQNMFKAHLAIVGGRR